MLEIYLQAWLIEVPVKLVPAAAVIQVARTFYKLIRSKESLSRDVSVVIPAACKK